MQQFINKEHKWDVTRIFYKKYKCSILPVNNVHVCVVMKCTTSDSLYDFLD